MGLPLEAAGYARTPLQRACAAHTRSAHGLNCLEAADARIGGVVEAITQPARPWGADELWLDGEHPLVKQGIYGWFFNEPPLVVPVGV